MSWTKRQFVEMAFDEIGLAASVIDLQPDWLNNAVRRLDAMMAAWNGKGIYLGYPMPSSPENTNIDSETNVPDRANEAIFLSLAVRLAPAYGKEVSRSTIHHALEAVSGLLKHSARPREMALANTVPTGAGNKPWRTGNGVFITEPSELLAAGLGGDLNLEIE